jgi:hypothetical protein
MMRKASQRISTIAVTGGGRAASGRGSHGCARNAAMSVVSRIWISQPNENHS